MAHIDPVAVGIEITRVLGLLALLHPELPYRLDRQSLRRLAWEVRPERMRSVAAIPEAQESIVR